LSLYYILFLRGTDKRVSRWIRYPLAFLAAVLWLAVTGFLVWVGIRDLEATDMATSIIAWLMAVFATVLMIVAIKDGIKKKKK